MRLIFSPPILPRTSSKVPLFHKFSSLLFFLQLIIVFVISLFILPTMSPAGVESTWEKYGAFFNSFFPDIKWLIRWIEPINYKIASGKVFVLSDQTRSKKKMLHIYIYSVTNIVCCSSKCWKFLVRVCVCVCVCVCLRLRRLIYTKALKCYRHTCFMSMDLNIAWVVYIYQCIISYLNFPLRHTKPLTSSNSFCFLSVFGVFLHYNLEMCHTQTFIFNLICVLISCTHFTLPEPAIVKKMLKSKNRLILTCVFTLGNGVCCFSDDDAKRIYNFFIIESSGTSKLLSSKYNQGHWLVDWH